MIGSESFEIGDLVFIRYSMTKWWPGRLMKIRRGQVCQVEMYYRSLVAVTDMRDLERFDSGTIRKYRREVKDSRSREDNLLIDAINAAEVDLERRQMIKSREIESWKGKSPSHEQEERLKARMHEERKRHPLKRKPLKNDRTEEHLIKKRAEGKVTKRKIQSNQQIKIRGTKTIKNSRIIPEEKIEEERKEEDFKSMRLKSRIRGRSKVTKVSQASKSKSKSNGKSKEKAKPQKRMADFKNRVPLVEECPAQLRRVEKIQPWRILKSPPQQQESIQVHLKAEHSSPKQHHSEEEVRYQHIHNLLPTPVQRNIVDSRIEEEECKSVSQGSFRLADDHSQHEKGEEKQQAENEDENENEDQHQEESHSSEKAERMSEEMREDNSPQTCADFKSLVFKRVDKQDSMSQQVQMNSRLNREQQEEPSPSHFFSSSRASQSERQGQSESERRASVQTQSFSERVQTLSPNLSEFTDRSFQERIIRFYTSLYQEQQQRQERVFHHYIEPDSEHWMDKFPNPNEPPLNHYYYCKQKSQSRVENSYQDQVQILTDTYLPNVASRSPNYVNPLVGVISADSPSQIEDISSKQQSWIDQKQRPYEKRQWAIIKGEYASPEHIHSHFQGKYVNHSISMHSYVFMIQGLAALKEKIEKEPISILVDNLNRYLHLLIQFVSDRDDTGLSMQQRQIFFAIIESQLISELTLLQTGCAEGMMEFVGFFENSYSQARGQCHVEYLLVMNCLDGIVKQYNSNHESLQIPAEWRDYYWTLFHQFKLRMSTKKR